MNAAMQSRLGLAVVCLGASVGPFDTWALCHAAIWWDQRCKVRPSWRTSGGTSS